MIKRKINVIITGFTLVILFSSITFTSGASSELRYFTKGHIKRQYSIIPEIIILDPEKIQRWIRKSIEFVLEEG